MGIYFLSIYYFQMNKSLFIISILLIGLYANSTQQVAPPLATQTTVPVLKTVSKVQVVPKAHRSLGKATTKTVAAAIAKSVSTMGLLLAKLLATQKGRLTSAKTFQKKYSGLLKAAQAKKDSKKIIKFSKRVVAYKKAKADAQKKVSVAVAEKKVLTGAGALAEKHASKKGKKSKKMVSKVQRYVKRLTKNIKRQVSISAKKAKALKAKKNALNKISAFKKAKNAKKVAAYTKMYKKASRVVKVFKKASRKATKKAMKEVKRAAKRLRIKGVKLGKSKVALKVKGSKAWKKKVKKACKFCKANINVKNGDNKLIVIKSGKELNAHPAKKAVRKAKKLLRKKKRAVRRAKKSKKVFRRLIKSAKKASKRLISRTSKNILLTHVTIVRYTKMISVSSKAKKLAMKKKIAVLRKKVKSAPKAMKRKAMRVLKRVRKTYRVIRRGVNRRILVTKKRARAQLVKVRAAKKTSKDTGYLLTITTTITTWMTQYKTLKGKARAAMRIKIRKHKAKAAKITRRIRRVKVLAKKSAKKARVVKKKSKILSATKSVARKVVKVNRAKRVVRRLIRRMIIIKR